MATQPLDHCRCFRALKTFKTNITVQHTEYVLCCKAVRLVFVSVLWMYGVCLSCIRMYFCCCMMSDRRLFGVSPPSSDINKIKQYSSDLQYCTDWHTHTGVS